MKIENRIDFLDYLRVFAFLSVLVGHQLLPELIAFSNNPNVHITLRTVAELLVPLCRGGAAGVIVFFITSGYIISRS